jgi:acetyl esterase/lipase
LGAFDVAFGQRELSSRFLQPPMRQLNRRVSQSQLRTSADSPSGNDRNSTAIAPSFPSSLVLAPDRLRGNVAGYAGNADPASDALSPLFADLHGIAPLLIQCGSNEVLLDDATRLATAAAAADAAVQLDVTPDAGHVF